MLPLPYLSISQINKYLTCPKQYEYRYVQKLPESKGSPLVVGSSFHKTIEIANQRKMQEGKMLNEDEQKEIYLDHWNENVVDIDWKEDEDPKEEKERGLTLAKAYLESDIGKSLNPVDMEARFDVEVEGIPFMGYIDIIDDTGHIRDLKTSKKTPANDVAEKSLQLAGYSFAYRYLTGEYETGCSLDYAISLKTAPKIMRLETEITENRLDRFKDTIWNVANAIDKDIYYRNEGAACSWCSFKDICKGE